MDGLELVLSNLPSLGAYGGFVVLLVLALRMAAKADGRYNAEVRDHEATQRALDEERKLRREGQDEIGKMRRRVDQLEAEVTTLQARMAQP